MLKSIVPLQTWNKSAEFLCLLILVPVLPACSEFQLYQIFQEIYKIEEKQKVKAENKTCYEVEALQNWFKHTHDI